MTPTLFSIGMYDEVGFRPSKSCFSLIFRWPCHLFRVLVNKIIWLWQKTYGPEHILQAFSSLTFHNVRFLTPDQLSRLKELSFADAKGAFNANGRQIRAMIQSAKSIEDVSSIDKLFDALDDRQLEYLSKGDEKNQRAIFGYFVRHLVVRPISFLDRLNSVDYGVLFSLLTKAQTPIDPFKFIANHLKGLSEDMRDQYCDIWFEGLKKEIPLLDFEQLVLCVRFFRQKIEGRDFRKFTDLFIAEILVRVSSKLSNTKEMVDKLIESIKEANTATITASFEGEERGYTKSDACVTESQCKDVLRYCDFVQALKLLCVFRYEKCLSAVIMSHMETRVQEYGREVANLDMQTLSRYYDTSSHCFSLGQADRKRTVGPGERLDLKVELYNDAFKVLCGEHPFTSNNSVTPAVEGSISRKSEVRSFRCNDSSLAPQILDKYAKQFCQDKKEMDSKETPASRRKLRRMSRELVDPTLKRRSIELIESFQFQTTVATQVAGAIENSDPRPNYQCTNQEGAHQILQSHRPEVTLDPHEQMESKLDDEVPYDEQISPLRNEVIKRGKELFLACPECLNQASEKFAKKIIATCTLDELKERNIQLTETQLEWLQAAERDQGLADSKSQLNGL